MRENKYIEDLQQIKEIMNRSTRFSSLGGLSGVYAGIFALFSAYLVYRNVYINWEQLGFGAVNLSPQSIFFLLSSAVVTIILSFGAVIFFSSREAKRQNQKLWDHQSRRALINFFIPMVTGGLLCLMFLFNGYLGVVAPLTLVFYGLALINTSKYTYGEVFTMGILEILLGLLAMQWMSWGLWIWAIGFGVLNIISGVVLHKKYNS